MGDQAEGGFTFVEAMVVVAIIAILAIAIIPRYIDALDRAHAAEVETTLRSGAYTLEQDVIEYGTYPGLYALPPAISAMKDGGRSYFYFAAAGSTSYSLCSPPTVKYAGVAQLRAEWFQGLPPMMPTSPSYTYGICYSPVLGFYASVNY